MSNDPQFRKIYRSKEKRRKKRKRLDGFRWEIKSRNSGWSNRRISVVLLLGVSALVWGVVWILRQNHPQVIPGPPPVSTTVHTAADPNDWHGLLPGQVVDRFVKAATWRDRLPYVRDADEVAPLMQKFYEAGPGANERIVKTSNLAALLTETGFYERYSAQLDNGKSRTLCMTIDDNRAKIDFKAYARYCDVTWPELLSGSVTEAKEMRLLLEHGNRYEGAYADDRVWSDWIGTSPDSDELIHVYARQDSRSFRVLSVPKTRERYICHLKATADGAKARQFELAEDLIPGWCVPEKKAEQEPAK